LIFEKTVAACIFYFAAAFVHGGTLYFLRNLFMFNVSKLPVQRRYYTRTKQPTNISKLGVTIARKVLPFGGMN
jgi:hypothetical protein